MKMIKMLVMLAVITMAGGLVSGQEIVRQGAIQGGPSGGFVKAGNEGAIMVSHVGVEHKGGTAGITVWSDGRQINLNILKDFPEANKVQIWDVAILPARGIAAAAILEEPLGQDKRPKLKTVILSYDSTGTLKEVWDVSPYEFITIAADKDGNIYGFGARADMSESSDFPMVVKYSPRGAILGEFLPRSAFPKSKDPADTSPIAGRNHLQIGADGSIILYVAGTQELVSMLPDGTGLKKLRVDLALEAKGVIHSNEQTHVLSLAIAKDGSIVSHVIATGQGQSLSRLVVVGRDISGIVSTSSGAPPGQLVGVDGGGNLIFHQSGGDKKAGTIGHYKPASILNGSVN